MGFQLMMLPSVVTMLSCMKRKRIGVEGGMMGKRERDGRVVVGGGRREGWGGGGEEKIEKW